MKKIFLKESHLRVLKENTRKEVTFYEFFINLKRILKDLLKNSTINSDDNFFSENDIKTSELINKMKDLGILISSENIDEVPNENNKLRARRTLQFKIPKKNFENKVKQLYNFYFKDKEQLKEDGEGGATSCGSAMQGGGVNPDAGQYTVPFGNIQRRKIGTKLKI